VLEGLRGGAQRLGRDAGGFTPEHTVWSSEGLRAEFGLGVDGRGALLHYPLAPIVRCAAGTEPPK
jgi:hypothetical protein